MKYHLVILQKERISLISENGHQQCMIPRSMKFLLSTQAHFTKYHTSLLKLNFCMYINFEMALHLQTCLFSPQSLFVSLTNKNTK